MYYNICLQYIKNDDSIKLSIARKKERKKEMNKIFRIVSFVFILLSFIPGTSMATQEKLIQNEECPADKPLRTTNGFLDYFLGSARIIGEYGQLEEFNKCRTCDSLKIWETTQKDCHKCANREYKKGYCYFKKDNCPNNTFWDDGYCFSCDDKHTFHSALDECAKCPSRRYFDGRCYLPQNKCKPGEVEMLLTGTKNSDSITEYAVLDGSLMSECVDCQTTDGLQVSFEDCSLCPNRKMIVELVK